MEARVKLASEAGFLIMPAQKTGSIEIVINGEPKSVAEGTTVLGLIELLGIDPSRVAVELDREIVRRATWTEHTLSMGSRLEVVHFVGGG